MKAVITGATKGIGRAVTLRLAQEGFDVAICARSQDDLHAFKEELEENYSGISVLAMPVDVRSKNAVLQFAAHISDAWSAIDVLVNNAGVFVPGKITEEADGILEQLMETNLYSAYHLTRALVPAMKGSTKPHIFNMCSVASLYAYPNGGSYSISKFALLGFSKVLREELKEQGIRVTAVLPGATWTDSWAGAPYPPQRMMDAKDVADSIWAAYALSPRAVVEEILLRPQLGDL